MSHQLNAVDWHCFCLRFLLSLTVHSSHLPFDTFYHNDVFRFMYWDRMWLCAIVLSYAWVRSTGERTKQLSFFSSEYYKYSCSCKFKGEIVLEAQWMKLNFNFWLFNRFIYVFLYVFLPVLQTISINNKFSMLFYQWICYTLFWYLKAYTIRQTFNRLTNAKIQSCLHSFGEQCCWNAFNLLLYISQQNKIQFMFIDSMFERWHSRKKILISNYVLKKKWELDLQIDHEPMI